MDSENEAAVAVGWGVETARLLFTERIMAGVKIIDTVASTSTRPTMAKMASRSGEIPFRVVLTPAAVRRTRTPPATHDGGAGLPIVSA